MYVVRILCYRPQLSGFLPWYLCNAIWRDIRLEHITFLSKTWFSALWVRSDKQLLVLQKVTDLAFFKTSPWHITSRKNPSLFHISGEVFPSKLMFRNKIIKKAVRWDYGASCSAQPYACRSQMLMVFNDISRVRSYIECTLKLSKLLLNITND